MSQYSSGVPRNAAFLVYLNGVEVPAIRVSRRFGVWQVPELQLSMVPDPVLTRLGAEDRVQVVVFFLDDTSVDPSVTPEFRLYFDGEITGWGYQSVSGSRAITFTAVSQIAVFTQLFVQFLTTFDDMLGHATLPGADATGVGIPSSQIVFPFSLFQQGLIPNTPSGEVAGGGSLSQDPGSITRPFDFLYNVVRNMIGSQVPREQQTVPAANFFARWARMCNFHNRFVASPFFDEIVDNPNIFPVLKALQNVSAVDTIARNLIPNVQNAGSIWDMIQLVFQTMLMEIAMIPSMPLVTVSLSSGLVIPTNFGEHRLSFSPAYPPAGGWVPILGDDSRKQSPKRIPSFFPKPQTLFGIPPSCNVIFPSMLKTLAYNEAYATQPTRLYFNDETLLNLMKIPRGGFRDTVHNALTIAYPPEADAAAHVRLQGGARYNGKNFLLWPEEFFKGPVLDRKDVPPWLFFLKQNELGNATPTGRTSDGAVQPTPAPTRAPASSATPPAPPVAGTMVTTGRVGVQAPNGSRVFDRAVEALRPRVAQLSLASGIPADFLLAWISHESGGDFRGVTLLNERGYFQIMGPHAKNGTLVQLKDTEAAQIGLSLADTGVDENDVAARLSTDADFSLLSGIKLVQYYRRLANRRAREAGLSWSEADMWRLTKLQHGGQGTALRILQAAAGALGRPPASWEEMYQAALPHLQGGQPRSLNNATAVGGVVAGATGTMVTRGDVSPIAAPAATPAPLASSDVASGTATTPSASGLADSASAAASIASFPEAETVYGLYAKFEFFRERYARRSGSAQLAWNPYVVPGFPMTLFDNRASRVDICAYVTTVQDSIDAQGRKDTTISFLYGRQLQEMFDLLARQFAAGEASAGSAPAEPIRDVRKVVQSFAQAEDYYRRLFYGAQPLYGKDASFDFRKIIGYAPDVPSGSPVPIFVDGPEEAAQDDLVGAQTRLSQLGKDRADKATQFQAADVALRASLAAAAALDPLTSEVVKAQLAALQIQNGARGAALAVLQGELAAIDARIARDLAVIQSAQDVTRTAQVIHNLVGDRELVPLPSAAAMFDSYEAAMRYAWRPICTLDEYIVFHDSAGEGQVPALGAQDSLGARYYERIRRMRPPDVTTAPPPGADGLGVLPVSIPAQDAARVGAADPVSGQPAQAAAQARVAPSLPSSFPQTRSDWDKALLAYRSNVRRVKAPRT